MKLLLVEDNLRLAEDMSSFMVTNGFIVEHAASLCESINKTDIYQYDLVIVDIGLPDGNGLDLIKHLKKRDSDTAILIVTAKNSIEDKVYGLDLGADDYITKPFHKSELNARIRSILRRKKFNSSNILKMNEIKIDIIAAQTYVQEKPVSLTKKEYDLLLYFMYNQNKVLMKENIAEHLWGDDIDQADSFDFIYNHIKNLRKKIIHAGGKDYIKSMYGMGYKFCGE
jgi:DNA-binding response OmpR family regulator